jgi:hypothetical protein
MNAFRAKLEGMQLATRTRFKEVLEQHVGEVAVLTHDRVTWSAFIGAAVLSGISLEEIADAAHCDLERVRAWLDGNFTEPENDEQRLVAEFVTKRIFEMESP